ncbi:type I methionyl aminopeptidase [Candidatus Saccharibacteria bacterium]|nr:type I methionyl aminopeptidase [Candidatus Saccharibacteria bacterium]
MSELITGQKTPEQLQAMREGGNIIATIFDDIRGYVHAGMTEKDIDAFVAKKIVEYGATATYTTAEVGFPGSICVSTNDEIVHGMPTEYTLAKGDVVSFDLVITYKAMKTDAAFTMVIDEDPKGAIKHLLTTTERSLYAAIDAIKGPVRVGDISAAIEKVLHDGKVGIIRELVGHGVGLRMHMPPDIPNFGHKGTGPVLMPGETIAIEPMATLGTEKIIQLDDNWTYATRDGSIAAHFEHTVLVTASGAEILTMHS